MNWIGSSHRTLLATVALCLVVVPASLIVPTDPAAAESEPDYPTTLKDLEGAMAALRKEIAQFRVPADYCGSRQPLKGPDQARMAALSARAQGLIDAANHASGQLKETLRQRTGASGRRSLEEGNLIDPNAYVRERNALAKAVQAKQTEFDKAARKPCGGGSSGTGTFVSTGPTAQDPPPPPKPPAGPEIPEINPPTYQAVSTSTDLPPRYCSVMERVRLQLALEAEQTKAHENGGLAGIFRMDVRWAIFAFERERRAVPPYLVALEARAIAEVAQWRGIFQAVGQLRQQAGRIPVVDCLAAIEKLRTGQAGASGTEVQPGFPTQRDPSQDVRRDVEVRVRDAEKHGHYDGADGEEQLPPQQEPQQETPAQGISGIWRLANASSGVSAVTISNGLVLTGMGPAIQLQRDGSAYYGEGAVLFGQGGHSVKLIDYGNGALELSAENDSGGRFTTTLSRG